MKIEKLIHLEMLANLVEISCVAMVIVMASLFQFVMQELPCPLCILQRVGFIGMAFGFMLNFRFGFRPSHYAIIILSAVFTSFVAMRQVVLHIIPGTGAYGSPFLGLHLYTWSFVLSMLVLVGSTLLMSMDRQYVIKANKQNKWWKKVTHVLFIILILLVITNLVSVMMECGLKACPDNPMGYELLKDTTN